MPKRFQSGLGWLFVLGLCLAAEGCVSCDMTIQPQLSGVVVGRDGHPISGAQVRIDTYLLAAPSRKPISLENSSLLTTGMDGTWSAPAIRKSERVYLLGSDGLPATAGKITISADGYEPFAASAGSHVEFRDWPPRVPIERIELKPKQ